MQNGFKRAMKSYLGTDDFFSYYVKRQGNYIYGWGVEAWEKNAAIRQNRINFDIPPGHSPFLSS